MTFWISNIDLDFISARSIPSVFFSCFDSCCPNQSAKRAWIDLKSGRFKGPDVRCCSLQSMVLAGWESEDFDTSHTSLETTPRDETWHCLTFVDVALMSWQFLRSSDTEVLWSWKLAHSTARHDLPFLSPTLIWRESGASGGWHGEMEVDRIANEKGREECFGGREPLKRMETSTQAAP